MPNVQKSVPRVWLVNLFFGHGVAPTGVLLEGAAVGLRDAGLDVTVLCGNVGYSSGNGSQASRFAGRVVKIFSGRSAAQGMLGRLCSWLFFYCGVALFAFSRRLPDVVILMTTPPFLHVLFALRNLVARRKTRIVLWNQDTYPEMLASVKILRAQSLVYRTLVALDCWAARRVSQGIALDQSMSRILTGHGIQDVQVIPNWEAAAPVDLPSNVDLGHLLRQAKEHHRYVVLYTGNYGWGHDLTLVIDFIRKNPNQTDFYFLFVGGGEKWTQLEALAKESNASCLAVRPYVPKEFVPALVQQADFGLVALENECVGLMSPSKIHGYLASGIPLLYLGGAGSNVAEAIENFACGWRIDEHDPARFDAVLSDILREDFHWQQYSENAFAAFARYSEARCVSQLVAMVAGSSEWANLRESSSSPGSLRQLPMEARIRSAVS